MDYYGGGGIVLEFLDKLFERDGSVMGSRLHLNRNNVMPIRQIPLADEEIDLHAVVFIPIVT